MAEVRHDESELQAGGALGPFDLLAQIGVGGMARVWAARRRGTTDVVALKMLRPELAENVEFRKMFFDEARIASRVRHPNVCGTFELGEDQETLYLVMEWLDGPSLMRVLRPGREDATTCERIPIRPRIAARIVADACAGLHAAHELLGDNGRSLGVVHRDVSPHNLLMTSSGEVKVTDFGVAKALGKSHMTIAGQLKGKLAYMAPEQLIGGDVDRRCDVFALGCVLYEITTGQRPFQGEHDPQVMAAIMMGHYEPPAARVRGYPHELSIIVMRALANEPRDRYASAEQMRQALETYLRNSGPSVGPAQVAALLQERCGEEMAARARDLHKEAPSPRATGPAPAPGTANPGSAHDSGSGAMMVVDGQPSPARRGVLWLVTAALLGAALGVGVLSYVRTARRAKSAQAAAEMTSRASAGAGADASAGARAGAAEGEGGGTAPVTTSPSATTATTGAPVATGALVGAAGRVRLTITPPTAILIIEGVVLPPGTEMIARPMDGSSMNVLVRAYKHDDATLVIDAASPDELEVALVPTGSRPATSSAPPAGSGAAPTRLRPRADAGAALEDPSDAPLLDAPPNPYD